jgi:hypothetical protein
MKNKAAAIQRIVDLARDERCIRLGEIAAIVNGPVLLGKSMKLRASA